MRKKQHIVNKRYSREPLSHMYLMFRRYNKHVLHKKSLSDDYWKEFDIFCSFYMMRFQDFNKRRITQGKSAYRYDEYIKACDDFNRETSKYIY